MTPAHLVNCLHLGGLPWMGAATRAPIRPGRPFFFACCAFSFAAPRDWWRVTRTGAHPVAALNYLGCKAFGIGKLAPVHFLGFGLDPRAS